MSPESPAQLYDLLQELFGVGSYDAVANPEPPYYASRMTEIAKIKAMLKRRRVTVGDVAAAAYWAHEQGRPIAATWQVFAAIPEAKRARAEANRQEAKFVQEDRRTAVVREAFDANEHMWAARLINASDREIDAVINQWRNR